MENVRMVIYALAQIADSLVIILTMGFVYTNLSLSFLVWWEKTFTLPKKIAEMKRDTSND